MQVLIFRLLRTFDKNVTGILFDWAPVFLTNSPSDLHTLLWLCFWIWCMLDGHFQHLRYLTYFSMISIFCVAHLCYVSISNTWLTIFFSMYRFHPPENIRKLKFFWCMGIKREHREEKRVNWDTTIHFPQWHSFNLFWNKFIL